MTKSKNEKKSESKRGAESAPGGAPETGASGAESVPYAPGDLRDSDTYGYEEDRSPRETVFAAVYAEAIERGNTEREARSFAEEVCDRLRMHTTYRDRIDYPDEEAPIRFYDLRSEQDYIYPGDKRKVAFVSPAKRVPVRRDPKTIDAIVIHQTACEFGVSKRAIDLAHGDVELARARRALDVACHALAFRNGYFVAAHDLTVYVHHANRLNDRSLGLEIEGRYPGLMDDPATLPREDLDTTWGGPPSELTELTVRSACAALRWLVLEGRKQGMPIQYIFAHRQSSDNRRSDPGEEIWKRVVLDYAVEELGLTTQPATIWRKGYPIPKEWDRNGKGSY